MSSSQSTMSQLKSYARIVQPLVREQQQPGIPAKPYFTAPAPHLLEEICRLTEDLELLDPEYRREMLQRIRSHAWGTAVYGEYPAPPDVEAQKLIIGKGGYYFKITTQNTGIYLIWHNRLRNIFGFWAPDKDTLFLAMNIIRSRLVKIVVHVLPEKRQAALYSVNMPAVRTLCETPPPPLEPITPPPAPERTSPPPITREASLTTREASLTRSVSSFRTGSMAYPGATSPSPEPIESRKLTYPSYEEAAAFASLEYCMKPRYSPPAHRRPMQRTEAIIAPEFDQMVRTDSMLYPIHLSNGQRNCSPVLERTDYYDDCRVCPDDIPGRREYLDACS